MNLPLNQAQLNERLALAISRHDGRMQRYRSEDPFREDIDAGVREHNEKVDLWERWRPWVTNHLTIEQRLRQDHVLYRASLFGVASMLRLSPNITPPANMHLYYIERAFLDVYQHFEKTADAFLHMPNHLVPSALLCGVTMIQKNGVIRSPDDQHDIWFVDRDTFEMHHCVTLIELLEFWNRFDLSNSKIALAYEDVRETGELLTLEREWQRDEWSIHPPRPWRFDPKQESP